VFLHLTIISHLKLQLDTGTSLMWCGCFSMSLSIDEALFSDKRHLGSFSHHRAGSTP
jgi:hypothetical protein